jgi:hypothetical protein|tara:strand:- start:12429 stop:12779 length:351 start_codon:yes stop_codon:yes gene_type:complete
MVLEITYQTGILAGIFLFKSYLGLDRAYGWYFKVKYFDKYIHFLSGIVIAVFMFDNNYSIQSIILVNLVIGILWELFQLAIKTRVGFKKVGFPDGYGDIIAHMVGTFAYLLYIGGI